MTKEKFAAMLNGREYGSEIQRDEEALAKQLGLVVVFGYSDDNAELRGAIHDEFGCFDGGTFCVHVDGVLGRHERSCECEHCGYKAKAAACKTIRAVWNTEGYSWVYATEIPHATFEIMEDGEKYCRGIVFNVSDLPKLP